MAAPSLFTWICIGPLCNG